MAFAESGHRVLCCDMDPQGNLTMSQGIDPDTVKPSMYDVLVHHTSISECIRKREIDVACTSIDLAGAEIAMSTQIGRERSLEKAFRQLDDDYDFIFIDTPPSLGLLTINALTAADKVIVPVQCEYLSMRGLIQLQNTLAMIRENLNPNVEIEGILPTLVDSRTVHAKEAIEILEENFGDRVFASRIRKTIRFAEAPVKGMSVLKYDPDGMAADAYRQLAKEVLGMASGKRASMREGPLAALFRNTDEDAPRARRRERRAAAPRARRRRPTQRPRARSRPRVRMARRIRPSRRRSLRRARRSPRLRRRRRRSGCATRSRSDIPDNILDRAPAASRPLAPPRDEPDPYARVREDVGQRPEQQTVGHPVLRVVGVGGAGVNALNRMVEAEVEGVEFIADQHRPAVAAVLRRARDVHIGEQVTRGLGAGADPELGRQAAMEEYDRSRRCCKGADMIFITAGAGGGTGTGAAPSWRASPARSAR